jgi:hypothetical protein
MRAKTARLFLTLAVAAAALAFAGTYCRMYLVAAAGSLVTVATMLQLLHLPRSF